MGLLPRLIFWLKIFFNIAYPRLEISGYAEMLYEIFSVSVLL